MIVSFDIKLTLQILFLIVSVVAILFLIGVLLKLNSIFSTIQYVIVKNKGCFDESLNQIPKILEDSVSVLEKSNITLDEINKILKDSKGNIVDSIENTNEILGNVKLISRDVASTTEFVSEQVVDTAISVRDNVDGLIVSLETVASVIEYIKKYFRKK